MTTRKSRNSYFLPMPRVHVPHHPLAAMMWLFTVGLFVSVYGAMILCWNVSVASFFLICALTKMLVNLTKLMVKCSIALGAALATLVGLLGEIANRSGQAKNSKAQRQSEAAQSRPEPEPVVRHQDVVDTLSASVRGDFDGSDPNEMWLREADFTHQYAQQNS